MTRDTMLKIAQAGVVIVAAAASPHFLARAATSYFRDKVEKAIRARAKRLRELQKRKLVDFKELGDGSVRIELTNPGKNLIRFYNVDEMKLKKPRRWDKQWRIVIYDIPVHQKKASDAFRQKLEHMGLFPLQRSVWISPYECLAEVEFLAAVFEIDIDRCLCYFHTPKIPKEREACKFFGL